MIASVFRPSIADRITSSCPGRKSCRPNTRLSVRRSGAISIVRATAAHGATSVPHMPGQKPGAWDREPAERPCYTAPHDAASVSTRGLLLGWVSLLTDAASEAIYPLLPFFLTTVLGGGPVALGAIEGVAEGTNSVLRIVSGRLADRTRARRRLVVAGYTLSSAARPLIALVTAWWQVLVIRFTDRIGKGVRSSPRDALLAYCAAPGDRGRLYGFHRAMDHSGAVVG